MTHGAAPEADSSGVRGKRSVCLFEVSTYRSERPVPGLVLNTFFLAEDSVDRVEQIEVQFC